MKLNCMVVLSDKPDTDRDYDLSVVAVDCPPTLSVVLPLQPSFILWLTWHSSAGVCNLYICTIIVSQQAAPATL